jgi:PPOX class probable F420-dependent enzyme
MDIETALAFCRDNHHSVLITRKADGEPQPSPVVHGVDAQGRVMISTREPAYKVRHLRHDPRATLCVLPDAFFGKWAFIAGTVEIIPLPAAMEPLIDLYRQVGGEHRDWDGFRRAMEREQRVILALTPERAGPNAQA